MVTLSSPIYDKDEFKGVVSVDFTTNKLKELINSEYETFLLDDQDSIITANRELELKNKTIKLSDIPDSSWNADAISVNKQNDTVQRIGNEFVYETALNDAPWRLILLVPVWLIIWKSVLSSLPVIIVCILLLWTISEIEKRKKTEIKLVDSLEELKAYHQLLENAAKYDFLTNTVNRRGLKESFEEFIHRKNDKRIPVSFIMGDIDYFKQFNDTYGHGGGGQLGIEVI
jgi:C4-dicarboxylate-specific signal transduction histidine kinase